MFCYFLSFWLDWICSKLECAVTYVQDCKQLRKLKEPLVDLSQNKFADFSQLKVLCLMFKFICLLVLKAHLKIHTATFHISIYGCFVK